MSFIHVAHRRLYMSLIVVYTSVHDMNAYTRQGWSATTRSIASKWWSGRWSSCRRNWSSSKASTRATASLASAKTCRCLVPKPSPLTPAPYTTLLPAPCTLRPLHPTPCTLLPCPQPENKIEIQSIHHTFYVNNKTSQVQHALFTGND